MQCTGNENSILQCILGGLVEGDGHMNDAGVMCAGMNIYNTSSNCTCKKKNTKINDTWVK